jgi:hypothetical protein
MNRWEWLNKADRIGCYVLSIDAIDPLPGSRIVTDAHFSPGIMRLLYECRGGSMPLVILLKQNREGYIISVRAGADSFNWLRLLIKEQ